MGLSEVTRIHVGVLVYVSKDISLAGKAELAALCCCW